MLSTATHAPWASIATRRRAAPSATIALSTFSDLRTLMNSHLPYRATTATGETIDVTFDLHAETRNETDVSALLTALLSAIDARVADREGVSNGDVMQALAMAMALRVAMIPAPRTVTEPLARDLLDTALSCASFAQRVPAAVVAPPTAAQSATQSGVTQS